MLYKSLVVVFLLCLQHCLSKTYVNTMSIVQLRRNKGWIFLDRMSFDTGTAYIKLNIKIETKAETTRDQFPLQLALINEHAWTQEQALQCNLEKYDDSDIILPATIRKSEGYTANLQHTLTISQPVTYHFVLKDCSKSLSNEYFQKQTKVSLALQMKNSGSQHGSDEHINKYLLPILLLITFAMVHQSKNSKGEDGAAEERDWAKFLLHITLIINLFAILFYYIGFLVYLGGGRYYGVFDFVYLLFHSISESVLSSLLLFVAYGWTITFIKNQDFDIYIPLVSMMGFINLILTLLGKVNDGDSDKYHMYDTIPSYILVFFRIISLAVFVGGIIKVYLSCKKNVKIVNFLATYGAMGAIYFLTLPTVMLLATFISPSSRKQIVFFSVQLIKNVTNLILTFFISSKHSHYMAIKHGSQSFFQEGNKLL